MSEEELEIAKQENKRIFFDNRICADTKPYFFAYVYDREMKKYRDYKNKYNRIASLDFQKKLSEIIESNELTDGEKLLKKNYYKYLPLRRNKCVMNILATYIEDIEFDNSWSKLNSGNIFNYTVLMNDENFKPDVGIVKRIKYELREFFKAYKEITVLENETETVLCDDYEYENTYSYLFESLDNSLHMILSNDVELCDYVVFVSYNYFKTYNKKVIWDLFGDTIVDNIKSKSNKCCFPCQSEDGVEYLGKRYKIKEVDLNESFFI